MDTHSMLDHQVCELLPIDEHDAVGYGLRELDRFVGEVARRDEDTLSRVLARQGTRESLDLGPPDGVLPPLRLYVHLFETKLVQRDDAYPMA